jgi:hypothetical protein
MKQPANCKYTPLEEHMRELSKTKTTLALSFEQIEAAMHSPLPKSARERLTWWDNEVTSTLSHKFAWLHAGWRVATVDLVKRSVRFVRSTI